MTVDAPDLSILTRWARGLTALAVAAVLATAALVAFHTDRAQAQPSASDWYTVVSRHSGLAWDVQGASTATGAVLTQYDNYQGENQQFRFLDLGNGYYKIQVKHSGLVLDLWNWDTGNGATIAQYTDLGGDNQQWRVTENSGYYTFVNRHSGKALDVWEWSTTAGSVISQYDSTGATNQQFSLNPVGSTCGADHVLAGIRTASDD
ncbi:MAG TPA: RICIN domain-containing protein [Glycomyces sp.]|nr:RICIN domain-containing protein [Glycomyces sp.]